MGIQINGNTNNINAGIGSLSIEDIHELDLTGIATASNFKTGVSNLHNVGLTLSGGQIDVGSNIKIGTAGVITATSFVGSGANLTGLPAGVTINNNANNRIITGSGTANTLEGESGLTFDGSTLSLTPASSNAGRVTIFGSEGQDARLSLISDEGDDHIDQYNLRVAASNNRFYIDQFESGAFQERFTIANGGNIGIGTDNPAKKLEVFDTTQGVIRIRGGGGGSNSSRKADLSLFASGAREYVVRADASDAAFKIVDISGSNAERLTITSGGQVQIPGGTTPFKVTHTGGDCAQFHRGSKYLGINADWGGNTGDSVISASTNFVIHTNGSNERLRIRSDGKVVIGTNYTGGTLSVTGNLITDDGTNGRVTIQGDSTSTNQILSTTTGFASYCNMKYQAADHIFLYGGTERFRVFNDGELRLLSENGNNSDTPGIRFRGGSSTQKANFARIHSRMVSNWGGQLQFKVKNDNGSLSDAYQTAMIMNHNAHVTKPNQPSFHVGSPYNSGMSSGQVWKSHSNAIYSNVGSHYNNSTGRFTAPVDGQYFFFHWGMSNTTGQTNDVYSRKNGSRDQIGTSYNHAASGSHNQFGCSYVRTLSAGDYVDVYVSNGNVYATTDGRHGGWGGWLIG